MKTIIAAFADNAAAQEAASFLSSRGVNDSELLTYQADADIIRRLSSYRIPDNRAEVYAEMLRRGAVLLIANAPDDDAKELAAELDRRGSLDVDSTEKRWRQSGWSGYQPGATPYEAEGYTTERAAFERDIATGRDLEVVEENVRVGKREVARGGVRVRTFITERPFQQDVTLREERVNVARERVNEPVSPAAVDSTFTEDEFVVTAKGEEAVVGKEARVVERVHVDKSAETRTKKVEETERRRDVEVQQLDEEHDRDRPRHR